MHTRVRGMQQHKVAQRARRLYQVFCVEKFDGVFSQAFPLNVRGGI